MSSFRMTFTLSATYKLALEVGRQIKRREISERSPSGDALLELVDELTRKRGIDHRPLLNGELVDGLDEWGRRAELPASGEAGKP